jgi:hypothetical protein
VLPEQLQGPGWAVARTRGGVQWRRCALRAGLAVRLLDPRARQREGFRSGGHGWRDPCQPWPLQEREICLLTAGKAGCQ